MASVSFILKSSLSACQASTAGEVPAVLQHKQNISMITNTLCTVSIPAYPLQVALQEVTAGLLHEGHFCRYAVPVQLDYMLSPPSSRVSMLCRLQGMRPYSAQQGHNKVTGSRGQLTVQPELSEGPLASWRLRASGSFLFQLPSRLLPCVAPVTGSTAQNLPWCGVVRCGMSL